MVFSDLFFLFVFIPAFAACYLAARAADKRFFADGNTLRNAVLILFSLIFYAWGEPVYLFLMIGAVAVNYYAGRFIASAKDNRKTALAAGITCNLLVLGVFKYAGFVAQTFNSIGIPMPVPEIRLPIGISFYIFQSISYLVDVYRKEAEPQQKFYNLLLYISMFPQLIAGPIVRYNTIAKEINERSASIDDISEGVFRFLIGLGKKVIIANQLGSISDQLLGSDSLGSTTAGAWVGLLAFSLQIYFDFSGYSDMAIGMGRCMGFHFNENFNHPYTCTSVTDFWRKWHISLGQFFRDYVYIPMGGNRKHQWLNIFCVWFLTGMWHGASWNFILWGLYFGIILVVEKLWLLKPLKKQPALGHLYSLLIVYVGWGIFYFDDFGAMQTFFKTFFHGMGEWSGFEVKQAITGNLWLWILALTFAMPVRTLAESRIQNQTVKYAIRTILSLLILFLSVSLLVGATNNAFLYFRF